MVDYEDKYCDDCVYKNKPSDFYLCKDCWETDEKPNFVPEIDIVGVGLYTQDIEYTVAELMKENKDLKQQLDVLQTTFLNEYDRIYGKLGELQDYINTLESNIKSIEKDIY